MLSNLPAPASSSVSRPPAKSGLSRRVSVTLYDPPVPKFAREPDATPSQIPTPPSSAHGGTTPSPQRRESLSPAPLTPTEPATAKWSKNTQNGGARERKTGSNKLQKSPSPRSTSPAFFAAAPAPAPASVPAPFKRLSMPVAPKPTEKRLSPSQPVTPTHSPTPRASFDATSAPTKTSMQPPIKPLPTSNSFYRAMPIENDFPNAQLLSPVSPLPGPPRTQSHPHIEEIVKRAHQHPPAYKRADTDPIALPPANPERPAASPAQSVINSRAPTPAPKTEPENAIEADPSPSRQNSAHSMTSASTVPSQVLETPSDLAQEQEQPKLPPSTKSSSTIAKASNHEDKQAVGMDMPAKSGPVTKTKSKDGHLHVSRESLSSHEHEHRPGGEKEEVLPPVTSKKNVIVQALVKRGEKVRMRDVSDAPASADRAPTQQVPTQQSPAQQPPPKSAATPSPTPSRAPPSAARTLLPMHAPSRRRQASSPISKGEVEAARALGVVLFYPLDKHVSDPGLLEELLAYLSFREYVALRSTSKRIHTMLEDRKELREMVLERFLATVGYVTWEFGIKEPLELTLKVCVRPQRPG